jgi:hypothetical protein
MANVECRVATQRECTHGRQGIALDPIIGG